MAHYQVNKTYQEINEKIKKGQAVVVTADEIIDIVRRKGEAEAFYCNNVYYIMYFEYKFELFFIFS